MARELNVGWAIAPDVVNLSLRPDLWAGPTLGFTNIQQNAIVYLNREIAEKAAKMIYSSLKKQWPKHRPLRAVRFVGPCQTSMPHN